MIHSVVSVKVACATFSFNTNGERQSVSPMLAFVNNAAGHFRKDYSYGILITYSFHLMSATPTLFLFLKSTSKTVVTIVSLLTAYYKWWFESRLTTIGQWRHPCFCYRNTLRVRAWRLIRARDHVLGSTDARNAIAHGCQAIVGQIWDKNAARATWTSIHTSRLVSGSYLQSHAYLTCQFPD